MKIKSAQLLFLLQTIISFSFFCKATESSIAWPAKSVALQLKRDTRVVENMTMRSIHLVGPFTITLDTTGPYLNKSSSEHSITFLNQINPAIQLSVDIFYKDDFMPIITQQKLDQYSQWLEKKYQKSGFKLCDEEYQLSDFLLLNEFPKYLTWKAYNAQQQSIVHRQYFVVHDFYNVVVSLEAPEASFEEAHSTLKPIWAFAQYIE